MEDLFIPLGEILKENETISAVIVKEIKTFQKPKVSKNRDEPPIRLPLRILEVHYSTKDYSVSISVENEMGPFTVDEYGYMADTISTVSMQTIPYKSSYDASFVGKTFFAHVVEEKERGIDWYEEQMYQKIESIYLHFDFNSFEINQALEEQGIKNPKDVIGFSVLYIDGELLCFDPVFERMLSEAMIGFENINAKGNSYRCSYTGESGEVTTSTGKNTWNLYTQKDPYHRQHLAKSKSKPYKNFMLSKDALTSYVVGNVYVNSYLEFRSLIKNDNINRCFVIPHFSEALSEEEKANVKKVLIQHRQHMKNKKANVKQMTFDEVFELEDSLQQAVSEEKTVNFDWVFLHLDQSAFKVKYHIQRFDFKHFSKLRKAFYEEQNKLREYFLLLPEYRLEKVFEIHAGETLEFAKEMLSFLTFPEIKVKDSVFFRNARMMIDADVKVTKMKKKAEYSPEKRENSLSLQMFILFQALKSANKIRRKGEKTVEEFKDDNAQLIKEMFLDFKLTYNQKLQSFLDQIITTDEAKCLVLLGMALERLQNVKKYNKYVDLNGLNKTKVNRLLNTVHEKFEIAQKFSYPIVSSRGETVRGATGGIYAINKEIIDKAILHFSLAKENWSISHDEALHYVRAGKALSFTYIGESKEKGEEDNAS